MSDETVVREMSPEDLASLRASIAKLDDERAELHHHYSMLRSEKCCLSRELERLEHVIETDGAWPGSCRRKPIPVEDRPKALDDAKRRLPEVYGQLESVVERINEIVETHRKKTVVAVSLKVLLPTTRRYTYK